ncbi:mCG16460, isoform CRA_a, partial [Mus musculus]
RAHPRVKDERAHGSCAPAGKRIVSSPGRKTRCDLCKQMIPENTYASHMKQCSAPNTVTRIRDESIIVIPSTLAFMDSGNRRSTVSKDVRPKT